MALDIAFLQFSIVNCNLRPVNIQYDINYQHFTI